MISDLAIFNFFANHEINSEFALPFSGTLITLIFKYSSLFGVVNRPQTLQQEELGLSLTLNKTVLFIISKNKLTCDEHSDADYYSADKINGQQKNERCKVNIRIYSFNF